MTPHDRWLFTTPWDDEPDPPGTEPGEECGRYHEPDEDAPKRYKPRPCTGTMIADEHDVWCDTCRETV